MLAAQSHATCFHNRRLVLVSGLCRPLSTVHSVWRHCRGVNGIPTLCLGNGCQRPGHYERLKHPYRTAPVACVGKHGDKSGQKDNDSGTVGAPFERGVGTEKDKASVSDASRLEKESEAVSSQKPDGPQDQRRPPWIIHCAMRTMTFFVVVATRFWKALRRLSRLDVIIVVIGTILVRMAFWAARPPPEVLYSDFVALVDRGAVRSAQFEEDSDRIYITLRPEAVEQIFLERMALSSGATAQRAESGKKRGRLSQKAPEATSAGMEKLGRSVRHPMKLMVRNIPGNVALATHLKSAGVRFGVVGASLQQSMVRAIGYLTILWVPLIPLFWFFRRSIYGKDGKKKDKAAEANSPKVTFADVAGLSGAKEELLEVVRLLKSPENYAKLNAKTPSGVLLCGPTGTGKTLLARAVAGEADVPFFTASASEFVEMFVGRGAARIRELFKDARKNVPCVVFIDEIDAVGGRRGYSQNDERDQTLNQLLVELDGFEGNPGIVLLAATNRPEILDPALLRPGRLTRKILVPLPDLEARCAILGVHLRDVPMQSEEEKQLACEAVARLTNNFSGAELANAVNEAALMAARESKDFVEFKDLLQGVRRTSEPVNAKQSAKGLGKILENGNQWFVNQWGDAVLEAQKELRPQPRG